MSDSQMTNQISSTTPAEVGDSDISSIVPTSPVHETLTCPSTVSQYSDIMSSASSNFLQNDNSAVPPLEYSSSPPMNILSGMILTSPLAATSDLEITENALFSNLNLSVSSKIILVSPTTVKHYFLSSLDLKSMQKWPCYV